ncbi:YicC family protein [Oligoflexia bacterium]|nr:YicC family protein [Oligoflexia bacterium]
MTDKFILQSMTGFGSAKIEQAGVLIEIEIRSVNSRFLDLTFRLPRAYGQFEGALRECLTESLHRGRVEVYVLRKPLVGEACAVELNEPLFDAYYREYEKIGTKEKVFDAEAKRMAIREILGKREILDSVGDVPDADKEKKILLDAAKQALQVHCEMRAVEGKKTGKDIVERLAVIDDLRAKIGVVTKESPEQFKRKLLSRIEKISPEIALDESRFASEVAYLSDRIDVTEELVRLESHISQFKKIMAVSPNGRKLDFMLQELGREFNTITSKAQEAEVQNLVVDAKGEVEKIKEQIQNIE